MARQKSSIHEQRMDFCLRMIARGYRDSEIIDLAQQSPLFRCLNLRKSETAPRMLSRNSVWGQIQSARKHAISDVARDPQGELYKAYSRLQEAFQMAAEQGDPKTMALTQRDIIHMLGLKKDGFSDQFNAASVRQQMKELDDATRFTSEDDLQEGGGN